MWRRSTRRSRQPGARRDTVALCQFIWALPSCSLGPRGGSSVSVAGPGVGLRRRAEHDKLRRSGAGTAGLHAVLGDDGSLCVERGFQRDAGLHAVLSDNGSLCLVRGFQRDAGLHAILSDDGSLCLVRGFQRDAGLHAILSDDGSLCLVRGFQRDAGLHAILGDDGSLCVGRGIGEPAGLRAILGDDRRLCLIRAGSGLRGLLYRDNAAGRANLLERSGLLSVRCRLVHHQYHGECTFAGVFDLLSDDRRMPQQWIDGHEPTRHDDCAGGYQYVAHDDRGPIDPTVGRSGRPGRRDGDRDRLQLAYERGRSAGLRLARRLQRNVERPERPAGAVAGDESNRPGVVLKRAFRHLFALRNSAARLDLREHVDQRRSGAAPTAFPVAGRRKLRDRYHQSSEHAGRFGRHHRLSELGSLERRRGSGVGAGLCDLAVGRELVCRRRLIQLRRACSSFI